MAPRPRRSQRLKQAASDAAQPEETSQEMSSQDYAQLRKPAVRQKAAVEGTADSDSLLPRPARTRTQSTSGFRRDVGDFVLLVFLYLLQGVPLGLCMGSIPFLLKSKLNFSDLALFSLSSYPYSLKLFWSPIVDSTFVKSFGRRKSWIVPIQAILGVSLLLLGRRIDAFLDQDKLPVMTLAVAFTSMVFLCATQDIAVDGWALTLLHGDNKTYASTAQTIGLNTGYFLSFTVFLALNSPEVSNKYFRSVPSDRGVLQLGPYLQFWGVMFLICNAWLVFFKKEENDEDVEDIKSAYQTMSKICWLPHMRRFIFVMLISKIGFIANEAVTGLKLLERGFSKQDLALAVLLDFPLQIIFGYYAAKWSSGPRPLRPWLFAFYGRLLAAIVGALVVYQFPSQGVTSFYFTIVIVATVFSSFMSTLQFVGLGSYFSKISDPSIGGTYMTLLNTLSNLGGTWPRYFVLKAVDYYTDAPCSVLGPSESVIQCVDEPAREQCKKLGGTCTTHVDGYYAVNTVCVIVGILSLLFVIQPSVRYFELLPDRAWRLRKEKRNEND